MSIPSPKSRVWSKIGCSCFTCPKKILGGDIEYNDFDYGYCNVGTGDVYQKDVPAEFKKFADTFYRIAIKGCGKEISELLKIMCKDKISIQDL